MFILELAIVRTLEVLLRAEFILKKNFMQNAAGVVLFIFSLKAVTLMLFLETTLGSLSSFNATGMTKTYGFPWVIGEAR